MMNEYQDKLMAEAKELERVAKEVHRVALMSSDVRKAYLYGRELEKLGLENIFWDRGKDGD